MEFKDRLKMLRTEKGLSLGKVADEIGVARTTVLRYENGTITNVPPETVHRMADFFGVTRPYMMGWTDERNVDPDRNLDVVAEKLRTGPRMYSTDGVWTPAHGSDCITAATQALRALVKFKANRTPVYPQQILQASPVATMITYGYGEELNGKDPDLVVSSTQLAADGSHQHIFAVNRNAPIGELSLALCIHIGHIYLGHTGEQKDCEKRKEAECFAIHLKFPRPVVRLLQERDYIFTRESFARIFGYCAPCLDSILNAPHVRVSPELNRLVKEQFAPYVQKLDDMGVLDVPIEPEEEQIDLSRYMEGYED